MKSSSKTPWIICRQPRPQAQYRLFCFHYAGGSASAFFKWSQQLPVFIEVCAIQLPGREQRLGEPILTNISMIVTAIGEALQQNGMDKPFAFFGHSMGSLISFEVARYLRRHQLALPFHLLISGARGPELVDPRSPVHVLPDEEMLDEIDRRYQAIPKEIRHHEELMRLLLPTIRGDFTIVETYNYTIEAPLPCPISVFGGLADDVAQDELMAWQNYTRKDFKIRMFPGGHFFIRSAERFVIDAVVRELQSTFSLK